MSDISNLQRVRASYQPKLPRVLRDNGPCVRAVEGEATTAAGDAAAIEATFPHTYGLPMVTFEPGSSVPAKACRVGVILSGGQAPGGHNVIAGIFDGLKAANPESVLLGFLGGPSGLLKPAFEELTEATIDAYRNTGGFDIIGSGRTKIETDEQFARAAANARDLGLDALVIIGGDDSNTNACLLAEYFLQNGVGTQVIGVPKTIDGDLKNALIETSFGFDTATKVYSELIGNIQRDANSAKKYWHFIKLMGRSASHIALECGLQTHANITIVSEEVAAENVTLKQIAEQVAGVVRDRAANGDNFGVVLIPEGLIEFIPEMKALIAELNDLLAEHDSAFKALDSSEARAAFVAERLGEASAAAFCSLPADIQMQLTMDRDPHGNVQVSRIETEKLVVTMVEEILAGWKTEGAYTGKFSSQCHFFGYEGRCAPPSNFDADYCYSLGYAACALILAGKTGYMSSVRNLSRPADEWAAGGVPLTMMMNMERRYGEDRPVIRKALVELDGRPFARLKELRASCTVPTAFVYPGPIQYFGPSEVCDQPSITLQLEQGA